MRGIFSILFSKNPDLSKFHKGLIILSCSDKYAERIARRVHEWQPSINWSIVKRYEPSFDWFKCETIFSCYANTLTKEIKLIKTIRNKKFDIVIITGTNEPSFAPLKMMGILTGYKSLLIFNENIDAFFVNRDNWRTLIGHARWRLRDKNVLSGHNLLLTMLSWLFLFPIGIVYIILKTVFLVIRKQLRTF
jgi:hypothetical protein